MTGCMMAVKKSAGVTPEVNLKSPLRTGERACWWGIHPGFETQDRCRQKSKTGVSAPLQRNFKKYEESTKFKE